MKKRKQFSKSDIERARIHAAQVYGERGVTLGDANLGARLVSIYERHKRR